MICLLPPRCPLCLEEEVSDNKGDDDDNDDNDDDNDNDDNDNDNDDDNNDDNNNDNDDNDDDDNDNDDDDDDDNDDDNDNDNDNDEDDDDDDYDNDNDDDDYDDDDDDDDAATANNSNKDMPPKAMTTTTKGAAASPKPPAAAAAAADTMMPPPAASTKPLLLYSIDVCNAAIVTYYNDAAVDYAEVKIHVNGLVPEGSCKFTVAADCMSILWQRATDKICFASEHLKAVMKNNYSMSHNRVIAYNDIAQNMIGDKVTPDAAGQFWGALQVIKLKARVTGTPKELFLPYPTVHTAEWKGKAHQQFNTLCHCKVQLEKQRFTNMVKAERRTINLFDLPSSQSSNNDPSPPPKKRRKKKSGDRQMREVVEDDEDKDDDNGGDDNDDNGGEKRGY